MDIKINPDAHAFNLTRAQKDRIARRKLEESEAARGSGHAGSTIGFERINFRFTSNGRQVTEDVSQEKADEDNGKKPQRDF